MIGSLRSWIVCSRCSENKWVGFFVKAASFSMPFFPLTRHSCGRLVTASPKTPARPSWFPLKITPTGEGWRLGFFANKATDG